MRLGKLEKGKIAGKDEIAGEMIKGGGNMMVDWIWRLCNMAFKSGIVSEDWKSALIVPLYKERGLNIIIVEVLACSVWLEKYMQGY